MGRKLDPAAPTADIHWHPSKEKDVQLCRDLKTKLIDAGTTIGDWLRPLIQHELKEDN